MYVCIRVYCIQRGSSTVGFHKGVALKMSLESESRGLPRPSKCPSKFKKPESPCPASLIEIKETCHAYDFSFDAKCCSKVARLAKPARYYYLTCATALAATVVVTKRVSAFAWSLKLTLSFYIRKERESF